MHRDHHASAAATLPLNEVRTARARSAIDAPALAKVRTELAFSLNERFDAVLREAAESGDGSATNRAIARRAGHDERVVRRVRAGERGLSAEMALVRAPLPCVEEFVDRVLEGRRAVEGDRFAARALRKAVDRIARRLDVVSGDERLAIEEAARSAIELLQRITEDQ